MTFGRRPKASLSSSPSVVVRIRWGDMRPSASSGSAVPTPRTEVSAAQYTFAPEARSYQSLPMMPWTDGVVPVKIEACPGPVKVGA